MKIEGENYEEIYFIISKQVFPARVKIGRSNNPAERLKTLKTGSPVHLELMGTMLGSIDKENEIHKKFKKDRLHGEWFTLTNDLKEFIKKVTTWL